MNERIIELRKVLNLSQTEFSEKIGIKQTSLSEIERGINSVRDTHIITICSIFSVNEDWLRNGIGEMFTYNTKRFNDFFEVFSDLNPHFQDFLLNCAKELLNTQNNLNLPKEDYFDKL